MKSHTQSRNTVPTLITDLLILLRATLKIIVCSMLPLFDIKMEPPASVPTSSQPESMELILVGVEEKPVMRL